MMMRSVWAVMAVTAGLIVAVPAGRAGAQAGAVQFEITVRAIVPHMHTVLLNSNGQIVQVISNTHEQPAPRFFVDRVGAGSEVPATEVLLQSYREAIADTALQPGVLFERPLGATVTSLPVMLQKP